MPYVVMREDDGIRVAEGFEQGVGRDGETDGDVGRCGGVGERERRFRIALAPIESGDGLARGAAEPFQGDGSQVE